MTAGGRRSPGVTFNELVGWERNNFDRVVHFSYGLLLAYPIRELFLRIAGVRGFWGYFLPLDLTMSTSALFELLEWAAAEIFGGDLGVAYLGTQGDVWDAHKDMALASLGALITMSATAFLNSRARRDFAYEWNESLRVKHTAPLNEGVPVAVKKGEAREIGPREAVGLTAAREANSACRTVHRLPVASPCVRCRTDHRSESARPCR